VREALRTLTHQGILETRHGAGTQVAQDPAPALETAFEFLLVRARPSLLDLYDTRELIEVYLAGRAAERRSEEELAAIEGALRAMGDGSADPTDLRGPNLRFHRAVAAAAHNTVLAEILACLYNGIRARIEAAGYRVGDWPVSQEIHAEIFEAIKRRNTQDAQRAMTVHMGVAIAEIRQIEEGASA
jgi:DNA-binding FadR family transcriptional regulator